MKRIWILAQYIMGAILIFCPTHYVIQYKPFYLAAFIIWTVSAAALLYRKEISIVSTLLFIAIFCLIGYLLYMIPTCPPGMASC
jgi:hypothetical protein